MDNKKMKTIKETSKANLNIVLHRISQFIHTHKHRQTQTDGQRQTDRYKE